MSGYDAGVEELRAAGFRLADVAGELTDGVGRLRVHMDGLLGADWRGGAAEGFREGWQQWESGFASAVDALATMGRLLEATGALYENNETDSQALVLSAAAGLA